VPTLCASFPLLCWPNPVCEPLHAIKNMLVSSAVSLCWQTPAALCVALQERRTQPCACAGAYWQPAVLGKPVQRCVQVVT
jgi:hypothetical protein